MFFFSFVPRGFPQLDKPIIHTFHLFFQLAIEAETKGKFSGDIAIDEVQVTDGQCSPLSSGKSQLTPSGPLVLMTIFFHNQYPRDIFSKLFYNHDAFIRFRILTIENNHLYYRWHTVCNGNFD